MMYNDVDNDLPPFTDTIDGEEIFLFSNTKTSSNGGHSFLNEDDDDLRSHQHNIPQGHHQLQHHHHHHNVVASTSTHLPIDVDELLLNLEQQSPNCDQADDSLFWNCKDIPDLNGFDPQIHLNLSNNSNNGNLNNNIINNNSTNNTNTTTNDINSNTTTNSATANLNNLTVASTANNSDNIHGGDQFSGNSIISCGNIAIAQQAQVGIHQHSQSLIPTQLVQAQQLSQQAVQLQQSIRLHDASQQLVTPATILHQPQIQTLIQHPPTQQIGYQQHQQPHQIIQHDQYQTKWITLIQSNDQYQAFHPQQVQFFDKVPHNVVQTTSLAPNVQTSIGNSALTHEQAHQVVDQHGHQIQQQQSSQQEHVQLVQSQQQSQSVVSVQPYQQIVLDSKPKISEPINSVNTNQVATNVKKDQTSKQKPKEKQTRLDCEYCKRSFSKNFDLQQHKRCHTGEKPFQCIVCGRGFAQKSNVKKHMQAHKVWPEGPNNPSVQPNHGPVAARSRNNSASSSIGTPRDDECMQENEALQINDNNNTLSIGASNDRKSDGNDIFAENRYSCSYCQFNGRTYFELKSHLTIHKREKVFKCIVSSCGKTFSGSDLQGFLDHVTGHKDLIYHCHLCSGQFYSLDEFGEHQKNHSNAQMKKSGQSQASNQAQQTPVMVLNNSSNNNNTSLRQQNQQVVQTAQLQTQQNQRQYNQQPIQTQQSNNQKSSKIFSSQSPKKSQKYFRCTKCMNRYTTQRALEHHMSISTHHFPCTECSKVFMCERYLRRHLNTHTTIQHVCSFCDKQFKTAAYLKMHSVVHTGEKPFRCNLCEAAFNRRDKLNRHKLTHETVKKYKCPLKPHIGCTKEFNRPDKLKAHVLTHSGHRPHPCDACSKTFSRLSRLREHLEKVHHEDNNNNTSNYDNKISTSSNNNTITINGTSKTSVIVTNGTSGNADDNNGASAGSDKIETEELSTSPPVIDNTMELDKCTGTTVSEPMS